MAALPRRLRVPGGRWYTVRVHQGRWVIERAGRKVLETRFGHETTRIGADPSNDVVLEGADIPPLAAVVMSDDEGTVRVRVLDANHGVRSERALLPGDAFELGPYRLHRLDETRSTAAQATRRIDQSRSKVEALRLELPDGAMELQPPGPLVLGRSDGVDLPIDADVVSSFHCELSADDRGWTVRDLGSTNGTFLDGVRIETARLPERGVLELGDLALRFGAEEREDPSSNFYGLVGASAPMRALFQQIQVLARLDEPVLVHGETGTGKELVATALHAASPRASKPMVARNCGAFAEGIVDSELFGSLRGAFSGAVDKAGVFEGARGGTVFLDELGELPSSVQPKLLRTLQERAVQRLGEVMERKVDFRLVAATHRNLETMVADQSFREDLFHRISVFTLRLPPLRERLDDIPLLVDHLLGAKDEVTEAAIARLSQHTWPGNIRELRNTLIRASAFRRGSRIDAADLSFESAQRRAPAAPPPPAQTPAPVLEGGAWNKLDDPRVRSATLEAWEQSGGSVSRAAALLGIAKSTMHRRKTYYGLS